jgi:hypothetical protein
MSNVFEPLCTDLAKLLWEKRQAYGSNNLNGSGEFFKLLYPDGIPAESYGDALILARMFDKMMRIAQGTQGEEDAWQDLAGYALCARELYLRTEGAWHCDDCGTRDVSGVYGWCPVCPTLPKKSKRRKK